MTIYLSLLVAIIGVLMFALSTHPKWSEIGHVMFWTGLLAFLLNSVNAHLGILKG
jgi:Na+/phosphate symporter